MANPEITVQKPRPARYILGGAIRRHNPGCTAPLRGIESVITLKTTLPAREETLSGV